MLSAASPARFRRGYLQNAEARDDATHHREAWRGGVQHFLIPQGPPPPGHALSRPTPAAPARRTYPPADTREVACFLTRTALSADARSQAFYGLDNATGGDIDIAAGIVSDVRAAGGILTLRDLQGYKPAWREPLRLEAMGLTLLARVLSIPLLTAGGD